MNNIILQSVVVQDEYTDYIKKNFDLEIGDVCRVDVPNKLNLKTLGKWNIGVICGASGSGKSTILNSLGKVREPIFDSKKSLISNFDNMKPEDATKLLSSIGLASVPTWIRPYNVLSNGEQYRARLAKILEDSKDDVILVDEYTSVVDRNVAKSMSNALQKYVRRNNKKIILATCHYDIFDWLQPDWIYDLNKGGALEKGESLRQRPQIELQVHRTTNDTWEFFKKHHYMTSDISSSAACYCFTWNGKLVAFASTLPLPSGNFSNGYRMHRLVVLPDFQGLGLGARISDFIGGVLANNGGQLFFKTVNPALGEYFEHSSNWIGTSHNKREFTKKEVSRMTGGLLRASYCHKYIGSPIDGYDNLFENAERMRYNKSMEGQLSLF